MGGNTGNFRTSGTTSATNGTRTLASMLVSGNSASSYSRIAMFDKLHGKSGTGGGSGDTFWANTPSTSDENAIFYNGNVVIGGNVASRQTLSLLNSSTDVNEGGLYLSNGNINVDCYSEQTAKDAVVGELNFYNGYLQGNSGSSLPKTSVQCLVNETGSSATNINFVLNGVQKMRLNSQGLNVNGSLNNVNGSLNLASTVKTNADDVISSINFFNGTDNAAVKSSIKSCVVPTELAPNNSDLRFFTQPDAIDHIERMRIASDGVVTVYSGSLNMLSGGINMSRIKLATTSSTKLAIGTVMTGNSQGDNSIAIGVDAGAAQGSSCVAIGNLAGNDGQLSESIAIGLAAGQTAQSAGNTGNNSGDGSIAIGTRAGQNAQSLRSIAIGSVSGTTNQGSQSIAIGYASANSYQGVNSIAIGTGSAHAIFDDVTTGQSQNCVAIGTETGFTKQLFGSVAIGAFAGRNNQSIGSVSEPDGSVAIGFSAGRESQNFRCVAMGGISGQVNQGRDCVAIGYAAGNDNQTQYSVAIGSSAASTQQGETAVAIGTNAGRIRQGISSIAIGTGAGEGLSVTSGNGMANGSICIGTGAGQNFGTGEGSIYIGTLCGDLRRYNRSILLSATGGSYNPNTITGDPPGFFVNPINIRPFTSGQQLTIDGGTGEITRNTSSLRYKKDINDLETNTSVLHNFKPKEFRYKSAEDNSQKAFGFIAEELNEIDPALVYFNNEGQPDSICWNKINTYTICEVQKLRKELDELKELMKSLSK